MDQNFVSNSVNTQNQSKVTKIIKRYGNRKLYDTEQSSYVVLNDIAKMIREEQEVQVIDNETKNDITSATLTQIIFGAEKKSPCSAPLNILKSIIKKGDGSFSNFLATMGLFTATPLAQTEIIEENKKNEGQSAYALKENMKNARKTIQERVASAALAPDSPTESETILPTTSSSTHLTE